MTALALKATMTVRRLPPLRAARSVAAERRRARSGPRVRGAAGLGRIGADLFGQLQDLAREVEQLLVLLVFLLDRLPLLVGENLSLGVRPVLADHHEGREEDRLERDDHGQQAEGVLLDAEADPAAEPDDVNVDERHRAGEGGDLVRDPVLRRFGALLGLLDKRRIDRLGELAREDPAVEPTRGRASRPGRGFARCFGRYDRPTRFGVASSSFYAVVARASASARASWASRTAYS